MTAARIDCHRCAHYFVTWDPCFPHGCRRMGFKSRMHPSDDVRRTMTGRECLLFRANSRRALSPSRSSLSGDAIGRVQDEGWTATKEKPC